MCHSPYLWGVLTQIVHHSYSVYADITRSSFIGHASPRGKVRSMVYYPIISHDSLLKSIPAISVPLQQLGHTLEAPWLFHMGNSGWGLHEYLIHFTIHTLLAQCQSYHLHQLSPHQYSSLDAWIWALHRIVAIISNIDSRILRSDYTYCLVKNYNATHSCLTAAAGTSPFPRVHASMAWCIQLSIIQKTSAWRLTTGSIVICLPNKIHCSQRKRLLFVSLWHSMLKIISKVGHDLTRRLNLEGKIQPS
jgi:hypothetical protein